MVSTVHGCSGFPITSAKTRWASATAAWTQTKSWLLLNFPPVHTYRERIGARRLEMMKIKFSLSKDRGEKHKERIPTLHTTSALTIDPGQDLWPIVKRMACDNSGREMWVQQGHKNRMSLSDKVSRLADQEVRCTKYIWTRIRNLTKVLMTKYKM